MVGIVKSSSISSTLETGVDEIQVLCIFNKCCGMFVCVVFDDFMLGNLLPFVEFSSFHIEDNSTPSVYMACRAVS